jgi:predicted nucleotidyltransferase
MRLTDHQIQVIRQLAHQVAGSQSRVHVFGSRLDDTAHGGDLDLMLELTEPVENPALMAARLAAQVSRAMHGRKVDVLLSAPNLMRLPIHDIAFKEGQLL